MSIELWLATKAESKCLENILSCWPSSSGPIRVVASRRSRWSENQENGGSAWFMNESTRSEVVFQHKDLNHICEYSRFYKATSRDKWLLVDAKVFHCSSTYSAVPIAPFGVWQKSGRNPISAAPQIRSSGPLEAHLFLYIHGIEDPFGEQRTQKMWLRRHMLFLARRTWQVKLHSVLHSLVFRDHSDVIFQGIRSFQCLPFEENCWFEGQCRCSWVR